MRRAEDTYGGLDPAALTPAQLRLVEELLAPSAPRPPVEPERAAGLRALLEERTAAVPSLRPAGAGSLRLNKTALDALGCDGRYLDLLAQPFAPSNRTVRGTLAHRAIELDQAGRRTATVRAVVQQSWVDVVEQQRWAGEYLMGIGGVQADGLRAEAMEHLAEFRACFPLAPDTWTVRTEPRLSQHLHGGAVELLGKPDLLLGHPHPTQRRILLIDLKTGRRTAKDVQDMRTYALLATLKYRQAPFRVATYYLDEADWDAEDVTDDVLEAMARTVADKAVRAARLLWAEPPAAELALSAGPACAWCGRAPDCPEKARADAQWNA